MKTIIFIGGVPRSGTTFLAHSIAQKSLSAVLPESHFKYDLEVTGKVKAPYHWEADIYKDLISNDVFDSVSGIKNFFDALFDKLKVPTIIDHTPDNFRYIDMLRDIEGYNVQFLCVSRNPLDVIGSVLPLDWGPNGVVEASKWYLECLSYNYPVLLGGQNCHSVTFEDLVLDLDRVVDSLCIRLGIDLKSEGGAAESVTLLPNYTSSQHLKVGKAPDPSVIGSYRQKMSRRDAQLAAYFLSSVASSFGYDLDVKPSPTLSIRTDIRSALVSIWSQLRNKVMKKVRQKSRR